MNTKPIKVRKRIVKKKSRTFKKIFSNLFANQHVENSWETNIVISLVLLVVTFFILYLIFMGPTLFDDLRREKFSNTKTQ